MIVYNHINEIWSIDFADSAEYRSSNNKGYRFIFVIIDNFSKNLWAIPLRNRNSKTITGEFSSIRSTSKRSPLKLESDRGSELYNSVFQNLSKSKNIHQYSRFTDKGPSIAERVHRTIRSLLKKPVFEKGNANWLSELSSVIRKYNNTNHHSIKKSLVQASKKSNEKSLLQSSRLKSKTNSKI